MNQEIEYKSSLIEKELVHKMVYPNKEAAPAWYFKRRTDFGNKGKKKNKSSDLRKRMYTNFESCGVEVACIYCNRKDGITVEHLIPKHMLGSSRKENLAPSCKDCNENKGEMTHFEYIRKNKMIDPLVSRIDLFRCLFHRDREKSGMEIFFPDVQRYCVS